MAKVHGNLDVVGLFFLAVLPLSKFFATAAVNSCMHQSKCIPGTKIGDAKDCHHYYECESQDSSNTQGQTIEIPQPRWIEKKCHQKYFSVNESKCIDTNSSCQTESTGGDGVSIELSSNLTWYMFEKTTVKFVCSFCIMSKGGADTPGQFLWYLNGKRLMNARKVVNITSDPIPDDSGFTNSTLYFTPPTFTEPGRISCGVKYNVTHTVNSSSVDLHVFRRPRVAIQPMALSVFDWEDIALKCTLYDSSGISEIRWHKDTEEIENSNTITLIEGKGYLILNTSAKLYDNFVRFSCDAKTITATAALQTVEVLIINANDSYCPSHIDDEHSIMWSITKAEGTDIQPCPLTNNSNPSVCSRKCTLKLNNSSASWSPAKCDKHVENEISDLLSEIQVLESGIGLDDPSSVEAIAKKLSNVTAQLDLSADTLKTTIDLIDRLATVRRENLDIPANRGEIDGIVQSISNVLEPRNKDSWDTLQKTNENSSISLLSSAEVYGYLLAKTINETESSKVTSIMSNNLLLEAIRINKTGSSKANVLHFPITQSPFEEDRNTSVWNGDMISIMTSSFENIHSPANEVRLWNSYFRNIDEYLSTNKSVVASRLISLSFDGLSDGVPLTSPISIVLHHDNVDDIFRKRKCAFWNFNSSSSGSWDESGCWMVSSNVTHTSCQCNHLTNFAILMSLSPSEDEALSVISTIGCSISVAALILTVILYAATWKQVKSDQAIVLMNLCFALIIANIIFLSGADKTGDKDGCIAVAVLLHYFFLAAFFIMLAEGVELLLYVIFVFHVRRKIETTMLIVAAWVLPLIIVSISIGATRTVGYGDDNVCWLAAENGLIWAFIGPALCIIAVNLVIIVIVLRKISFARLVSHKKEDNITKIRGMLWNISVICPVLGIAWVFGILSVISSSVVFQYMFAIANTLQGLIIFIFHALFHNQKINGKLSVLISQFTSQSRSTESDTSKHTKETFGEERQDKKGVAPTMINYYEEVGEMNSSNIAKKRDTFCGNTSTTVLASEQSVTELEDDSGNNEAEIYSVVTKINGKLSVLISQFTSQSLSTESDTSKHTKETFGEERQDKNVVVPTMINYYEELGEKNSSNTAKKRDTFCGNTSTTILASEQSATELEDDSGNAAAEIYNVVTARH